ncbi:hypothetical protein ACVBEF_02300 [Glaciimonas sp. GG7]
MKLNVLKQATLVFALLGGVCAGPAQAMNPVMEAAKGVLWNLQSQEQPYLCYADVSPGVVGMYKVMATSKAAAEAKFNGRNATCSEWKEIW